MHLTILGSGDLNKKSLGKKTGRMVGFLVRVISFIWKTIIYGSCVKAIKFVYRIHVENMEIISVFNNSGYLTEKQKKTKFPIYFLIGIIMSLIFSMIPILDLEIKVYVIFAIIFITLMMDFAIDGMRVMGHFSDDDDDDNGPL